MTDLEVMLQQDLHEPVTRLALADLLQDAGREEEALLCKAIFCPVVVQDGKVALGDETFSSVAILRQMDGSGQRFANLEQSEAVQITLLRLRQRYRQHKNEFTQKVISQIYRLKEEHGLLTDRDRENL